MVLVTVMMLIAFCSHYSQQAGRQRVEWTDCQAAHNVVELRSCACGTTDSVLLVMEFDFDTFNISRGNHVTSQSIRITLKFFVSLGLVPHMEMFSVVNIIFILWL